LPQTVRHIPVSWPHCELVVGGIHPQKLDFLAQRWPLCSQCL